MKSSISGLVNNVSLLVATLLASTLALVQQANADCDVSFDGEKLEIKCDDADDSILVRQDGAGSLLVDIGSGEENVGPVDDLKDVVIESEGGNDIVAVVALSVTDSVEVKTGKGNDFVVVAIDVTIGNDLKIETGSGADVIRLGFDVLVANSVDIKTGGGGDTVDARFGSGVIAGNDIKINGEGGNDLLEVGGNLDVGNSLEIKDFETVNP